MYNDKQSEGERFFEQNEGQTPVVLGTPYGYNCNMAPMSIYDASVRFTPGNIKISRLLHNIYKEVEADYIIQLPKYKALEILHNITQLLRTFIRQVLHIILLL